MLTVIDEWTRECLAIEVGGRINSSRVIEVLSRLMSLNGHPTYIRSDNVLPTKASCPQRQSSPTQGGPAFYLSVIIPDGFHLCGKKDLSP
jgi:hypothetical protein